MAKIGMMDQYMAIKNEHPDKVLFFRMGDFYEMFHEDAVVASETLGLSLTSRDKKAAEPIPMAGFPWHALESQLRKMLRAGHRVVLVEQTDPAPGSKLMQRVVTRIYTPGSLHEESLLGSDESAILAGLCLGKEVIGLAILDPSTGRMQAMEFAGDERWTRTLDELLRYSPDEIVMSRKDSSDPIVGQLISQLDNTTISHHSPGESARTSSLKRSLDASDLGHIDLDRREIAMKTAGLVADYICTLHLSEKMSLRDLEIQEQEEGMILDQTTLRNLELTSTLLGEREGSLLHAIDRTRTWMGRRRLKSWMMRPSTDPVAIEKRLDAISSLKKAPRRNETIREELKGMRDLERLAIQLQYGRSNGRDLVAIASCLEKMPSLKTVLNETCDTMLIELASGLTNLEEVREELQNALLPEQPLTIKEGCMFRDGWSEELDSLRNRKGEGRTWVEGFELQLRETLEIPSLKVRYNRQIGWYIEVTKTHLEKVPGEWIRRQGMTNAQRFTTEELQSWEDIMLNAGSRADDLEFRLFKDLRTALMGHVATLSDIASSISSIDVLSSLAHVARSRGWSRPEIRQDTKLEITGGRHPVLDSEEGFIANDSRFDGKSDLILITGPNMGGKSTYLRQTALITILAQMGSFVPADKARIGLVDRVFTRVGASDDLKRGRSTFMMEMIEVAHILRKATDRSLLLLDEVGRGTSTFDGLSLAWAICEDIATRLGSRAMFATHYHQLTGLEDEIEGLRNVHVTAVDVGGELRFMHRIMDGPSDDSFGVHVAAMAGLPEHVVERARDLLVFLEKQAAGARAGEAGQPGKRDTGQSSLMGWMLPSSRTPGILPEASAPLSETDARALEELRNIEPDHLSPKEALDALYRLRDLIQGRHELMQE